MDEAIFNLAYYVVYIMEYSINIIWSDEDNGYIATVPEFRNLSAFGKTSEEALKEAKIILDVYIETLNSAKGQV